MTAASPRKSAAAGPLRGEIAAPGDKSISHRALILSARAEGCSEISGLLEGDDVLRTAAALRALGVRIERDRKEGGALWRIEGGPWRRPETALYFGNSGTGARLMMGAVAGAGHGSGFGARFDGDASLRRRPMGRILDPLAQMGAATRSNDGLLPVEIEGRTPLAAIDYALPKPSAQIKSAALLAALGAEGTVTVRESAPSRDHTERMLAAFGAEIETAGGAVRFAGGQKLKAARIAVPGDISSAAFLIAAALIVPGSDIIIRGVGVNPLRAGLLETLNEMGADVTASNARAISGEPVADLRARHSALKGVRPPAPRAPAMIDEYPILAVLAAFATGTTRLEGLSELRVKESDRLAAIEAGLKASGVACAAGPDWIEIEGAGSVAGGARIATHLDHRIAMSFLILGLAAHAPVEIDDDRMIATSFPGFFGALAALGAGI